jgi:purine-binding chemotaxis protein CheW
VGIDSTPALVVTSGSRRTAIPIAHVRETMRPQPVTQVAGAPRFVRGVAMIRGAAIPVVDLGALLDGGDAGEHHRRFVTVETGTRLVALAVDDVIGVRSLDLARLSALPPLLGDGATIEAIGAIDAQLVVLLRAAHVIPDEVWSVLDAEPAR